MTWSLDSLSLLLLYSAMSVYTLAFLTFAVDLSRRRAPHPIEQTVATVAIPSATGIPGTGFGGRPTVSSPLEPQQVARGRASRVALALLTLGWLLHLGSTVLRGWDAGRLPWANMYEFSLTGTLIIVAVYLVLLMFTDVRYLGTLVSGLMLVLLGIAAVRYYVPVAPLQPALQSYWLVIHVFVALVATGFFAVAAAISGTQLLRSGKLARTKSAARAFAGLPTPDRLETAAYRLNLVGFILWTFTLIAGAIWAERAWGRYWGWDTKEVWTFIVWVLYAGYIHARATRGWNGTRSAWLGLIGFSAVLFNFGIVNVFFTGLHSYSGL
jgi:cytochrome c-type biogenesis protein CcsB